MYVLAGRILVHTVGHSVLKIARFAGVSANDQHHVRADGHEFVPEILPRGLRGNLITCVFSIFR